MVDAISIGEMLVEFCPTDIKESLKDARSMDKFVSGAPVITAIALSRLGLKTGYVGKVGKDAFGDAIVERLKNEQIDVSHIARSEYPTSLAFVEPDVPGIREKRRFIFYLKEEASGRLSEEDIDEDYIGGAKAIHFPGSALSLTESATSAVYKAVKIAKKHGVIVSFDPNVRLELMGLEEIKRTYKRFFPLSDIVQPNLDEAKILFDVKNEMEAADAILECGAKYAAVSYTHLTLPTN